MPAAAHEFVKNFSFAILDKLLFLLKKSISDEYLSPITTTFCLKFIANSLQIEHCYRQMEGYFNSILLHMCIPLLAMTEEESSLLHSDVETFIYSSFYKTEDYNMVKNASEELIKKICDDYTVKEKNKRYETLLTFVNSIIECLDSNFNKLQNKPLDYFSKEYLLHAFEAVTDLTIRNKFIRNKFEDFVVKFLLPDLSDSKTPLELKIRILSIYSKIGNFITFRNVQDAQSMCQAVCNCLGSKNMAVQVFASEALCALLYCDNCRDMLRSNLEDIISIVLGLINKFDYDGTVRVLEIIIQHYADSLQKHADKLLGGLVKAYFDFRGVVNSRGGSGKESKEEEAIDESERAAEACLDTMINLMKAPLPLEVYKRCTDSVLNILNITILENNENNFQSCLILLNLLIFKSVELSDQMLCYFPILCYLITGKPNGKLILDIEKLSEDYQQVFNCVGEKVNWFQDIDLITKCLLNFIQKCGSKFITSQDFFGVTFVTLVFQVCSRIIDEGNRINQLLIAINAFKLYQALLENLPGKMDNYMEDILKMLGQIVRIQDLSQYIETSCLCAVSVCYWYNPLLALNCMKRLGDELLPRLWREKTGKLTSDSEKERKIFALTSLLKVNPKDLPAAYCADFVMPELARTAKELLESKKYDMEDNELYGDEGSSEDIYKDSDDGDEYEEEDDDFDDDFHGAHYDSPLLANCSIVKLKEVLEEIEHKDKNYFSFLIDKLSKSEQEGLIYTLNESVKLQAKASK